MITSLLAGRVLSGKNNIKVISRVYYAAGKFYLKKNNKAISASK